MQEQMTAYDEMEEEIRRSELRGELRGKLLNSHRLLLRLGRKKYGEPDSATEGQLTSIEDLERLDRLADAILTAQSWQELLATP